MYRAPDIRCPEYRQSWLTEWLREGTRGVRFIQAALADLERMRDEWHDRATEYAIVDIRRALDGGE
jgi:hypothetical protein